MTEPLDYVRCVFCRELIRWDAIKCKHCQSTVVPQRRQPVPNEVTSKGYVTERHFEGDAESPVESGHAHHQSSLTKPTFLRLFWFWGLILGAIGGVIVQITEYGYVSLGLNIEGGLKYGLGWCLFGLIVDGFVYVSKRRWIKMEEGNATKVSLFTAFHWSLWLTVCVWFGRYVYLQRKVFGLHWAEYVGESAAWGLLALLIGLFVDFKRAQNRRELP